MDMFPFLVFPVLLYNFVALFSGSKSAVGEPGMRGILDSVAFNLPMLSGVMLAITWGELMVLCAIVFLFIEVVKSTSTASSAIVNHILSLGLFIVCLIQFLLFQSFATGPYLIITMIVLLDGLAGMVVTTISARRDFGIENMGN